jgi:hypothetical protein
MKKQKTPEGKTGRSATVNGILVVAPTAAAAAKMLHVERSQLFDLRDRGFPGFHPSSRVYLLDLRDAIEAWEPASYNLKVLKNWWSYRFGCWMDREGFADVPPWCQGEGFDVEAGDPYPR